MNSQDEQFLNLKTIPARVRSEEAALLLGFSAHEIPMLISAGLLKPLGRPPSNGVKYFVAAELLEFRQDRKWLTRASDVVVDFWRTKNARRKTARFPVKRRAAFA